MAAPPPTDSLIAALLAAVLGVFAPATGFVVTVLKPAPTTACSTAGSAAWEAQAQQLADQLAGSGSADAQSLRQQLASAGVTPSARNVVAPTTEGAAAADWQDLAAKLSGELANSSDPEAQKLAQAIGDTGTPDTGTPDATNGPRMRTPTTAARSTPTPATPVPSTSAPGAARPMPGDTGTTTSRSPSRSADPGRSTAQARPGTGPCPAPSGREAPSTNAPSTGARSTPVPSTGTRPTTGSPTPPTSSNRSADQRWEQLAGQLAAALAGSTDPRAADLRQALERAGFPSARPAVTASRAAPRTTAVPVPDDPGGGG